MSKIKTAFSLEILKVQEFSQPISDQIHVIYPLKGTFSGWIGEAKYSLEQNQFFVVDHFQAFQLQGEGEIAYLHFSFADFQRLLPGVELLSLRPQGRQEYLQRELSQSFSRLMFGYFSEEQELLQLYRYFFEFWQLLMKSHGSQDAGKQPSESGSDPKLTRVLKLITQSYAQPLSLEQLAEESGLSYSYLSRLFKRKLGTTFSAYLNQTRLLHAAEELLSTDHSVTQVALDNGFSDANSLHRVFKKEFAMTPSQYRKTQRAELQETSSGMPAEAAVEVIPWGESLERLADHMVEEDLAWDDESLAIESELRLSAAPVEGRQLCPQERFLRVGKAEVLLHETIRNEVRDLLKELSFSAVIFEGFCEEPGLPNGISLVSEYLLNDQVFDFLVENDLKPLIRLELAGSTQAERQRWLEVLAHCLLRYGKQELAGWRIQLSHNGTWDEVAVGLYEEVFLALRQLLASMAVGVLAFDNYPKEAMSFRFLMWQVAQRCRPRFITFGADPYFDNETRETQAQRFSLFQAESVTTIREIVTDCCGDDPEYAPALFLIDWNTLVGEGRALSGTFFRSAIIVEAILANQRLVDGLAYWLNIKVKELLSRRQEESSLSLFLYGGLKRPLFYTLSFIDRLQGQIIAEGPGYFWLREQETYYLLLFNSSYIDPQETIDRKRLDFVTKKLTIKVADLPSGTYRIRQLTLDKDNGGIYNDWLRIGSQLESDREMVQYLQQKILPKFELTDQQVPEDALDLKVNLTLNATQLVVIERAKLYFR